MGKGSLRKDAELWERPEPAALGRTSTSAKENIRESLTPCEWAWEQPGPGSRHGRKGLPGPWHQHPPLMLGQRGWLPVKASKGCVEQAGGPGWTGLPETEMAEPKEAAVVWGWQEPMAAQRAGSKRQQGEG